MSKQIVHYTPVAKFLHWLVAGMIVVQFVLATLADNASSDIRELALLANHKSVGITILAVAVIRILWRFMNRPPALPASMPKWQVTASHVSHWSLYALLFLVPITGWLMSSASAYSVSWFNLFQLPDFVGADAEMAEVYEEIHEVLATTLLVIASVHLAAALKHALSDKDDVLRRMVSGTSLAIFAIVAIAGSVWLGTVGNASSAPTPASVSAPADNTDTTETQKVSELPVWDINYAASYIKFIGIQSGAEFEGTWESWSADIQFSADDLDSSVFDVTVDTSSANTRDADRDSTLEDPEWFDTSNFPTARFRASRFSTSPSGGFVADGQLTIKGSSAPVTLNFTVEHDGDSRVLTGEAQLNRLEHGVGTGEWQDTESIGATVRVEVRVEATLPR